MRKNKKSDLYEFFTAAADNNIDNIHFVIDDSVLLHNVIVVVVEQDVYLLILSWYATSIKIFFSLTSSIGNKTTVFYCGI